RATRTPVSLRGGLGRVDPGVRLDLAQRLGGRRRPLREGRDRRSVGRALRATRVTRRAGRDRAPAGRDPRAGCLHPSPCLRGRRRRRRRALLIIIERRSSQALRVSLPASYLPHAPAPEPPSFDALFEAEFAYVWTSLRRLGVPARDLEDVTHDVLLEVY